MRENSASKGRRYLAEGRLLVREVSPTRVSAACKGDGEVYALTGTAGGWTCSCPALSMDCCHLIALRLVTVRPLG